MDVPEKDRREEESHNFATGLCSFVDEEIKKCGCHKNQISSTTVKRIYLLDREMCTVFDLKTGKSILLFLLLVPCAAFLLGRGRLVFTPATEEEDETLSRFMTDYL